MPAFSSCQALGECAGRSVSSATYKLLGELEAKELPPTIEVREGLTAVLCSAVVSGSGGYITRSSGTDHADDNSTVPSGDAGSSSMDQGLRAEICMLEHVVQVGMRSLCSRSCARMKVFC